VDGANYTLLTRPVYIGLLLIRWATLVYAITTRTSSPGYIVAMDWHTLFIYGVLIVAGYIVAINAKVNK